MTWRRIVTTRIVTTAVCLAVLTLALGGCASTRKTGADEAVTTRIVPPVPAPVPPSGTKNQGKIGSSDGAGIATQSIESTVLPSGPDDPGKKGPPPIPSTEFSVMYFEYDSWILKKETTRVILENFAKLQAIPSGRFVLEGHCDERGDVEYNLSLGEERAKSVKNYLNSLGFSAERLQTVSYGKECPQARGREEAAWARNRRVILRPESAPNTSCRPGGADRRQTDPHGH